MRSKEIYCFWFSFSLAVELLEVIANGKNGTGGLQCPANTTLGNDDQFNKLVEDEFNGFHYSKDLTTVEGALRSSPELREKLVCLYTLYIFFYICLWTHPGLVCHKMHIIGTYTYSFNCLQKLYIIGRASKVMRTGKRMAREEKVVNHVLNILFSPKITHSYTYYGTNTKKRLRKTKIIRVLRGKVLMKYLHKYT